MIFEKPNEDAARYNELMFVAKIAGTTLEDASSGKNNARIVYGNNPYISLIADRGPFSDDAAAALNEMIRIAKGTGSDIEAELAYIKKTNHRIMTVCMRMSYSQIIQFSEKNSPLPIEYVIKHTIETLEKEMVYQAFEKIAKLSEKLDQMIDENNL